MRLGGRSGGTVRGLLLLCVATAASADGGFVRASERVGAYTVTVFTAPTPLRVGAADVSVLVQQPDGGVVLDVPIAVTMRGGDLVLQADATRAQATNKLLHAALLEIPAVGAWTAEVRVDGATLTLTFDVAAAPPRWQTYWPYLALPFVGLGLFILHQWLLLRRHR